jgi:hypothetical protein
MPALIPDVVASTIGGLGVDGYALLFERAQRCGVGCYLGERRRPRRT